MILERALEACRYVAVGLLATVWLAACGSGAVGDPNATAGPLAVIPGSATLYSGIPTSFLVSGGTGSFSIASSNQNAIPNVVGLSGASFNVVANQVGSDTPVTLTIRDSAGAQATLSLTVKPRTVENNITITPTSSQSALCGTAICSGGDAEVTAKLSQNGVPLVGRSVLFEAISGDFRFITSPSGSSEILATSLSTTTDSTGTARVRIRVLPQASPQTALLQVTDTTSGAFQRASFTIAVANAAALTAQPPTISFEGRTSAECASNISADVIVVGGRPPYTVSNPGTFIVSPTVIAASGGRFTVTATGQCGTAQIAVVDAIGASTIVRVTNVLGTARQGNELAVGPTSLTLGTQCTAVGSVIVAGGVGNYFAVSSDPDLQVTVSGNTASIVRTRQTGPGTKTVPIAISDGREVATVQVTVPACT